MNKAIKELYCSYDQLKINISDTFQSSHKEYRRLYKRYKILNIEMKRLEKEIENTISKVIFHNKDMIRSDSNFNSSTTFDSYNSVKETDKNFFISKQEKLLKIEKQYKTSVYLMNELKQTSRSIITYWDNDYKYLSDSKQSFGKENPVLKKNKEEEGNESVINMLTSCGMNRKKDEDLKCLLI